MLTNYLKVALRAIGRYPLYAFVSTASLAVGFAACLVIYLYIQDERSYDTFHPEAENTYRLTRMWEESGFRPNTPAPVGPLMASENPDAGVMANPPTNAHFRPEAVISIGSLPTLAFPAIFKLWGLNAFKTYVTLADEASPGEFAQYANTFFRRHRQDSTSVMGIQALTEIHLQSNLLDEFEDNGDARFLHLLSALAILIVLIAAINYTNLASARASTRGIEVGMRRAAGANRGQSHARSTSSRQAILALTVNRFSSSRLRMTQCGNSTKFSAMSCASYRESCRSVRRINIRVRATPPALRLGRGQGPTMRYRSAATGSTTGSPKHWALNW